MPEFIRYSQGCHDKYHSSTLHEITELRAAKDKTSIRPSENLKWFARCVISKNGPIEGEIGANYDYIVEIGVAYHFDETALRAKIESCKPNNTGPITPDE